MIHYEDDYVQFGKWDTPNACFLIYKRFGTSEEFRSANQKLLAYYQQEKPGKLMVDARFMGALDDEDQEWVSSQITPALIAASPQNKYFSAMVTGDDVFARLGVENIESSIEGGDNYQVGIFANPDEAKNWFGSL
ncbi:MAG: hypothetical protein ACFB10_21465 [Salibacteraceae bacterium]|mgnify:CR=1 FL=1